MFVHIIFLFVQFLRFTKSECLRETKEGPVIGILEASNVDPNVKYCTFRGIPYAKPPVGFLRFKEPLDPDGRLLQILDAKRNRPPCVQIQYFSGNLGVIGSEDCLYVNIYIPKHVADRVLIHQKVPVMVWIYGGFWTTGSISEYEPDYFMERKVIVVTVQYRVGVLGFLNSLDGTIPGNLGLKDQIKALHWIRQNIEHFNGDNRRITIFGSGSGAASVGLLILSPLAKGLFHRAISQSGSSLTPWTLIENPREVYVQLLQNFRIGPTDNVLRRLQSISAAELVRIAHVRFGAEHLLNGYSGIHPSIEPEVPGAFLTRRPYDILLSGNFNRVPYIAGYNSQDGDIIFNLITRRLIPPDIFARFPRLLIPANINQTRNTVNEDLILSRIRANYFRDNNFANPSNLISFITDQAFIYGIKDAIRLYSEYVPSTFCYKFTLSDIGNNGIFGGVSNNQDLRFLWMTNFWLSGIGRQEIPLLLNEKETLIRKRFIIMWTNFATFGNPTPVGDSLLQNLVWPTVRTREGNPTLVIGENLRIEQYVDEEKLRFWLSLANRNLPPVTQVLVEQPILPLFPVTPLSQLPVLPSSLSPVLPQSSSFPQGSLARPLLNQFPLAQSLLNRPLLPQASSLLPASFPISSVLPQSAQFPNVQNIPPFCSLPQSSNPQFNLASQSPVLPQTSITPRPAQSTSSITPLPQSSVVTQQPFTTQRPMVPNTSPQSIVSPSPFPQNPLSPTPLPQSSLPGTPLPQGAFPQNSIPQGTFPQSSFPQSSIPQSSFPQSSFPQSSFPQSSFPQSSFPQSTFPQSSFPQSSFPQSSFPQGSFPQSSFPQGSIPQSAFPQSSFPQSTFPQSPSPQGTFPQGTPSQGTLQQGSFPQSSLPQSFPPQSTFPQGSLPQTSFPQSTLPQSSFPQSSFPPSSFPQSQFAPPFSQSQALLPCPSPLSPLSVPPLQLPNAPAIPTPDTRLFTSTARPGPGPSPQFRKRSSPTASKRNNAIATLHR